MNQLYWRIDSKWAVMADKIFETVTAKLLGSSFHASPGNTGYPKLQIIMGCTELCAMLLHKNEAYGNSALESDFTFAPKDLSPSTLIRIRLDDKLKRMKFGQGNETEDLILDMMGYLILLRIAEHNEGDKSNEPIVPAV